MGSANWRRYAFGSRAKSAHRDVGKTFAMFIRDETPEVACFASMATLAIMCGKSESNVRRSRDALEEMEELRIERRPGRTDLVFINWDALQPPTEREQKKQRARLRTGAPSQSGNQHGNQSGTGGTAKRRAQPQARTALTDKRAPRSLTSDEPRGTTSDEGAPSASAAEPPAASAPQLSAVSKFVKAWDRIGVRCELDEETVRDLAEESGAKLDQLFDLRLVRGNLGCRD
jgi:hypothetical protein